MFHDMWNGPTSATTLLQVLTELLRERLPASWQLCSQPLLGARRLRQDYVLTIGAPDGTRADVAVEVKSSLEPADVPRVLDQLARYGTAQNFLVAAPFIGPRARQRLAAAGVGYADATGNLRLTLEQPALVVDLAGANTNPWPDTRPLRSLKGPAAGRVVRALCDFRPPFGVRQLAARSTTSAASISRVATLLEREALITRDSDGTIVQVDWAGVLRRWVEDYALTTSNRVRTFLEPRGLPALLDKLTTVAGPYAVTGSLPAVAVAPVAPARLAVVYVQDTARAAEELQLRPAEVGANTLLAEPFDPVVFDRSWTRDGIVYTALTQVAADLLTSPGRGPAEGEALMRWMADNEHVWRV
jgi:hypothetical protein